MIRSRLQYLFKYKSLLLQYSVEWKNDLEFVITQNRYFQAAY